MLVMTQIKVADALQNGLETTPEKETVHPLCSQPPGQLQKDKEHGIFYKRESCSRMFSTHTTRTLVRGEERQDTFSY